MPKSLLRSLALLAAGAAIPTALMTVQTARAAESAPGDSDTYKQLDQFMNVFQKVRADYVDKTNDKDLIKGAIDGMLASLDPHSSYMDAHDFQQMKLTTDGNYGGLGLTVQAEDGVVKVVTPTEDTPAWRAGIKSGDYITRIGGKLIYGTTLDEAVDQMRGEPGSKITLTIVRPGRDKPFDVTLTRENIVIKPVKWQVKGNIGIININSFSKQTGADTRAAIAGIDKQLGHRPTGYIIDLRDDPGGLLDQAIETADAFLDHGEIVSQRGREKDDIERYYAKPGDDAHGLPIIVLVNAGSASAAEIVAGALQDQRRALVMGERSFGKGSVQTLLPLTDDTALRLTTARYFTPSGRSVQEGGIQPDIAVPQLSDPDYKDRPKFREDDLRRHLINEAKVDDSVLETDAKTDPRFAATADALKKQGVNDYQLSYALQTLARLAPAAPGTKVADILPPTGAEIPTAN
ncbi:S41 family peptidase [Sphingomonas abietis]|uniref:S41 family peptidase n=1 Tax=Sphingomonas abietis TaxID=3012344 RepID=A0ABY7NR40_9SPHN|nr:S41 family peptidase [Sphingomonas abietis]WBO23098.1 S41 family peptidase [Sphingomonas abietis]